MRACAVCGRSGAVLPLGAFHNRPSVSNRNHHNAVSAALRGRALVLLGFSYLLPALLREVADKFMECVLRCPVRNLNDKINRAQRSFFLPGTSISDSSPRSLIARARSSHSCRASSDARVGLMMMSGIQRRLFRKGYVHEAVCCLRHPRLASRWALVRGWRIDKASDSDQVDAVVALAMALDRATQPARVVEFLGWI